MRHVLLIAQLMFHGIAVALCLGLSFDLSLRGLPFALIGSFHLVYAARSAWHLAQ